MIAMLDSTTAASGGKHQKAVAVIGTGSSDNKFTQFKANSRVNGVQIGIKHDLNNVNSYYIMLDAKARVCVSKIRSRHKIVIITVCG